MRTRLLFNERIGTHIKRVCRAFESSESGRDVLGSAEWQGGHFKSEHAGSSLSLSQLRSAEIDMMARRRRLGTTSRKSSIR
jgi:hypothetical protein